MSTRSKYTKVVNKLRRASTTGAYRAGFKAGRKSRR